MKISYDKEVDALSIIFADATVTTKHLAEGIAADFDGDGMLLVLRSWTHRAAWGAPRRSARWK